MSEEPRLFASDDAVRRIGAGLLDHSLPKAEWTHEAHLAACLWIIAERPDIDADAGMRAIISSYNVAVGGVNDDHGGYHDTITRCFVIIVRDWLSRSTEAGLVARVNGLLLAPEGKRDGPLRFYTRDRLFSVEARRSFVPPDIMSLPLRNLA